MEWKGVAGSGAVGIRVGLEKGAGSEKWCGICGTAQIMQRGVRWSPGRERLGMVGFLGLCVVY